MIVRTISQELRKGQLLEFFLSTTDPDLDDILTFDAKNLPEGATLNPSTAKFSWVPEYNQAGHYENLEFCVQDNGEPLKLDCELITITVDNVNRPSVVDAVAPITIHEYDTIEFTITATDPDGDDISLFIGSIPNGSIFDTTTGLFSWTPNYDQAGNYSVTFFATDDVIPNETGKTEVIITVADIPPTELADEIIDTSTNDLDLPNEVENSFYANLKKVEEFIENGQINSAINQLHAFINKVEKDIADGLVSSDDGQMLIDMANDILSKLV